MKSPGRPTHNFFSSDNLPEGVPGDKINLAAKNGWDKIKQKQTQKV